MNSAKYNFAVNASKTITEMDNVLLDFLISVVARLIASL